MPDITLRPIQLRAIDRVAKQIQEGRRRVCLTCPTGFGKTVVGADIVRRVMARGQRALWLTHRAELLQQSASHLLARGIRIGINGENDAACQVASLDTLVSRQRFPAADLVVFDECHHAAAETWGAVLDHYKHAICIGLTATPERSDGKGLDGYFDALVVGATVPELLALDILVPLRVERPAEPMRSGRIAQSPVDAYVQHADGGQGVVFSPSVALAQQHAEEFVARGFSAACVHGAMDSKERERVVAEFKAGRIKVLTNVSVLTEGFDHPAMTTVILARSCGTAGILDQIIGRGVRSAPGKTEALLLDLSGATHVHGLPAEGRSYSLTGVGIASSSTRAAESYCRVCGEMLTPGQPCPDCGAAAVPVILRIMHAPLERYDYAKNMAGDPPGVRYTRLVRWIRAAMAKGHNLNGVKGKFRAVYRCWPTAELWNRALEEARMVR